MKFAKFLRTPCFTEHLQWLLLTVWGLQPATLLKMFIKDIKDVWLRQRWFLVNFAKILRTSFLLTERLRMTASCVYQWILRSFPEHLFYRAPFSTTRYSKKLFHRCFLSILYKNEKYPFEGVHLLKIPENCLWRICNEVARCQYVSLQKKRLLHILHHVSWLYFLRIYLQKRLWKCASTISSRKYKRQVVLLVIYSIMIPLSQLSSCWIWHLTFSWVQFLSYKLKFFFSCNNIDITRTVLFMLFLLICSFSQICFVEQINGPVSIW